MENEEVMKTHEIRELPKLVADKIAAGEVVDRPLSIVKELLENAIDAGANSIVIEIKNGGRTYVRVTDNGSGIEKEQVELAFKRHATSKIRESEDLSHIISLGFRGEALSSIAAVSRVELITKVNEAKTGISIKIEGGVMSEKTEIGCPEGTTIIVSDLFYNTPAREKFLKADHTESSMIIDFVSKMTLAFSDKKIRLINNGHILFSTNGKSDILTNILTVYSKEMGNTLIHFKENSLGDRVEGFISSQQNTKTNKKSQIFFVNGRYIHNKILDNSVSTAYAEKIMDGRHPTAFLFLQVPPETLDVNIHPNKKEVRFHDEKSIFTFVSESIRKNLNQKEAVPLVKNENIFKLKNIVEHENRCGAGQAEKSKQIEILNGKSKHIEKSGQQNEKFTEKKQKESQVDIISFQSTKTAIDPFVIPVKQIENPEISIIEEERSIYQPKMVPFEIAKINILSSIFNTYILGADEDSFYLIDQHAAHERVFYEELMAQYESSDKLQQTIMIPIVKEVSYAIKENTNNWLIFLRNVGFDISQFGVKSYIIKAVPVFMDLKESEMFLDDFFDTVDEDTNFKDKRKSDKIILKACKSAVKAHDKLDIKEMDALLLQLIKCENPFSCPHGRPVFIRLTKHEIEKMFKRI